MKFVNIARKRRQNTRMSINIEVKCKDEWISVAEYALLVASQRPEQARIATMSEEHFMRLLHKVMQTQATPMTKQEYREQFA